MFEEDAYEMLQDYLDRLERTLKNESGSKEIIEDVELRIAEICTSKLNESKTVIELTDIEEILSQLGDPSDYIDEDEDENHTYEQRSEKSERRLFRDTENATIGGVCSGIASFFNIDVVIVRALFVIIFLFAGFGIPLYVILWIIIPEAKSSIDRLRMKGRPITVESVKSEVENAAGRVKDGSKKFAERARQNDVKSRIRKVLRILAVVLGVALIVYALIWLVTFLIFIVGGLDVIPVQSSQGFMSLPEFAELVLLDGADGTQAFTGILMFGFSFILFLMLLGTMLIAKLKNRWSGIALGGLFICGAIGVVMCITVGLRLGSDFTVEGEIEREIASIDTMQLVILPKFDQTTTKSGFNVTSDGDNMLLKIEDESITMQGVRFKYIKSEDSLFHVYQSLSCRGNTHEKALERAENIDHSIGLRNDTLFVNSGYSFPTDDKLRDQEVEIIIEIPDSAEVIINDQFIRLDEDDDIPTRRHYIRRGKLRGSGEYRQYN